MFKNKPHNIPIDHFDFDYLIKCEDTKEIEKIVKILRSQREGHFPDLTKFAEDRLKEVAPNSKALRIESAICTKHTMLAEDFAEVNADVVDWTQTIKAKEEDLKNSHPENLQAFDSIKPAIRSSQQLIDLSKSTQENKKICSTHDNYAKWDKYDPDTEILRMDLQEEKNREKFKEEEGPKIQEITDNDVCRLSVLEKKELAKQHKYKGNDFFRAGDYKTALEEYTASLKLDETFVCLNNRALVYFKLSKFAKAIADCHRSLSLEPTNTKALFRKAESLVGLNRKSTEAFDIYQQILNEEPQNKLVLQKIDELRKEMPDLELKQQQAHRMKIIETGKNIENQKIKQKKPQVIVEDLHQPAFINNFPRYMNQSSISFDLQKKPQQSNRNNVVTDKIVMPYHRDINDDDFLIRESK